MRLVRPVRDRAGGWMLLEMLVSIALLGVLIWTVSGIQADAARTNHYHFARQQCLSAAEASLDWLAATGDALPEAEARRLWPKVDLEIRRREGQGPWTGLDLVRVVASGRGGGQEVRVELARYLAPRGGSS